jgi:uncharacterized protein YdhG (YjbR/CyaY superfamily)
MTVTVANAAASAAANQPTTVGAYLRDLPPDRRVAMARVCSMIRRSARGVRESMRYGLAFYELDGPLFALESGKRHMSLYVAEQDVVVKHKDALPGVDTKRSFIKFSDLNRLPLDVVEKVVRDSVAARPITLPSLASETRARRRPRAAQLRHGSQRLGDGVGQRRSLACAVSQCSVMASVSPSRVTTRRAFVTSGWRRETAAICSGRTNMPLIFVVWSARPIQPLMRMLVRPQGLGSVHRA